MEIQQQPELRQLPQEQHQHRAIPRACSEETRARALHALGDSTAVRLRIDYTESELASLRDIARTEPDHLW